MGLPDAVILKMLELGADAMSKNKMGAGKSCILRRRMSDVIH